MTKDEVLAGREMDALVAERVMGWRRVEHDDWPLSVKVKGGHSRVEWYPPTLDSPIGFSSSHVPFYSTDWNAMGTVIERLQADDFWFSCDYKTVIYRDDLNKPGWFARFRCVRGGTRGDHFAAADTLPLAVCRAALLLTFQTAGDAV